MRKGALILSCATMAPERRPRACGPGGSDGAALCRLPDQRRGERAAEGALTVWPRAAGCDDGRGAAFAAMAAKVYRLGDEAGVGAAFKMVNQLLAGVHIAAASEAMVFAGRLGLDLRKVYEVITGSAGNSWMFENRMPHVLDGDYAPRSAVEIFTKDLGIISDMSRAAQYFRRRSPRPRCRCS